MSKAGTRILPCAHAPVVVAQVKPAQDLLVDLDTIAPELLREHHVEPFDYRNSQVFRTAIESIRGHFAASMTGPRQEYVAGVLSAMVSAGLVSGFEPAHQTERWDYQVRLGESPQRIGTVEVKGGEGNNEQAAPTKDAACLRSGSGSCSPTSSGMDPARR